MAEMIENGSDDVRVRYDGCSKILRVEPLSVFFTGKLANPLKVSAILTIHLSGFYFLLVFQ